MMKSIILHEYSEACKTHVACIFMEQLDEIISFHVNSEFNE